MYSRSFETTCQSSSLSWWDLGLRWEANSQLIAVCLGLAIKSTTSTRQKNNLSYRRLSYPTVIRHIHWYMYHYVDIIYPRMCDLSMIDHIMLVYHACLYTQKTSEQKKHPSLFCVLLCSLVWLCCSHECMSTRLTIALWTVSKIGPCMLLLRISGNQ